MKILQIDYARFHLPDNFKGTLAQALRLLAKYVSRPKPQMRTWKNPDRDLHGAFLEVVKRRGKVVGRFGLKHWDGFRWIKMQKRSDLPMRRKGRKR